MFRITKARLGLAFWGFYVLAAATLIAGLITSTIIADLLLASMMIAIGFHGLLEEHAARESRKAFRRLDASFQQLGEWIEKANMFMRSISERYELRMYHLDTKRSLAERKFERKARDLSKKIIDLENKLNSIRKTLAGEKYKPLTSFEKRVARTVTILKKEGMITTSVYSRRIRVSTAIARNDLKKMTGMKIIRKRGKGRNAYYIIAI
jgi:Fic family protein